MTQPKRTEQVSLVLNPSQLAEYALVSPELPALVIKARNAELRRQFIYAVLSLSAGIAALLSLIGGYIYLVMQGHPHAALGLLAGGVLGLGYMSIQPSGWISSEPLVVKATLGAVAALR